METDDEAPEVFQAELDPPTLASLFADLEAHADVIEIRTKAAARGYAGAESGTLSDAAAQLAGGTTRGVQIRYRHEGTLWMDTLMRVGERVRLVRIRVPDRPQRPA